MDWCLRLLSTIELIFCLELMSSSSVFCWTCVVSRIDVLLFFLSWTYISMSNWCLHLWFLVELAFVSGIDVFIFCLQSNVTLHLELISSSTFISWCYLCIWNWCLHLLSSVELTFVSRTDAFIVFPQLNLPLYFELTSSSSVFRWTYFVSRIDGCIFIRQLNLFLHLELMSSSSFLVELISISRIVFLSPISS